MPRLPTGTQTSSGLARPGISGGSVVLVKVSNCCLAMSSVISVLDVKLAAVDLLALATL